MSLFKSTLQTRKKNNSGAGGDKKGKRKSVDFSKTLHAVHKENMETINQSNESVESIRADIDNIKRQITELDTGNIENIQEYFNKKNNYEAELAKLEEKLDNIINKRHQLNYFSNTNDLLYQYYKKPSPDTVVVKKPKMIDFFSSKTPETTVSPAAPRNWMENHGNKRTILKKYYIALDKQIENKDAQGSTKKLMCEDCDAEVMKNEDGYIICPLCGVVLNMIYSYDKHVYNDPPPDNSYFAYKKISHLNELLAQIQGIETTEIDNSVYEALMKEIKKDRRTDLKKITADTIKKYLKKLGLNNYYEHIPHILYKLTGIAPIKISPKIIEKIKYMFNEIQEPFERIIQENRNNGKKTRSNIISYKYILYKFMEILGLDSFKHKFTLLKNRDNIIQHDIIWKKIMKSLGWKYIPTV